MSHDKTLNSNELVKVSDLIIPDYSIQPTDQTKKELDALSNNKYLPRIQLVDGNSKLCKEHGQKPGNYLLVRSADSFTDLTNTFDAILFARRAKAVRMSQAGLLAYFDPKHAEFQKIIDESDVRDSGCFYGPEYLMWVKSQKAWSTLLCASKTARRSSAEINVILEKFDKSRTLKKAFLAKKAGDMETYKSLCAIAGEEPGADEPVIFNPFATFKSSIKRKQSYTWWGIDVMPCSTPFGVAPPADEINEQLKKFLSPPKTEVETVEEPKNKRAR